ncbi:MAG TPA: tripartite tricarboxylate transporter substrate binding protein [Alphaproteobacteria bacterium]
MGLPAAGLALALGLGLTWGLGLAWAGPAAAENWPQKPVKLVVPFAAGGNSDGVARLIAQPLSQAFNQQFVVEDRPGANGVIASEYVARASPDGYTLLMATTAQIAVAPAIGKVPYDPAKDFAPVCAVSQSAFVIAINKTIAATNLREFIDYVKDRPGKLAYGSGGVGSLSHLTSALFLKKAGLDMVHVVYKGGAPATVDLLAGQLPMTAQNFSDLLPHVGSPDIRLLAVSTLNRTPFLPAVPTIDESGYPGFETVTRSGLMAPAQTPPEIVERLGLACARLGRDPKLVERLASFGVSPLAGGPKEYSHQVASEIAFWAEQLSGPGLKLE